MEININTGNTTGFQRNVDSLNRIVIPIEIIRQQAPNNMKVAIYPLEKGMYIEFVK